MRAKPNYILFACWLMFFWSTTVRAVFFTVVPAISFSLDFTAAQSGILLGVFFLGYASAVWISGFVPGSRKSVVIGGAILSIVAFMLLSSLKSFPLFMIVAPLSSFGVGLYVPRGISLITEISHFSNRGRNMSLHEVASVAGLVLGPLFVSFTLQKYFWENIFLLWAVVGVFALIIFSGIMVTNEVPQKKAESLGQLIHGSKFIYLILITSSMFVLLVGLISILPTLMVHSWNIQPEYAASFVGWTRVAALAGLFGAGITSDYFGRLRLLSLLLGVSFVLLVIMAISGFNLIFTFCVVALAITSAGAPPVFFAALAENYSESSRDKIVGMVSGTGSILGVACAPAIFGFLIENFAPWMTFLVTAIIVLCGWLSTYRLRNMGFENRDKANVNV
ncbi:MAG: MFS transporter [Bacillota bacterium]